MSTTPNLGMLLPAPSVTLGPLWASEVNAAFLVVDAHNHAPGSGAPISFSALTADVDLNFGAFNAYGLRTLRLANETGISLGAVDIRALYSKNGELYYRDANSNEVVLTNAGSIAGSNGSISGLVSPATAVFNAGRFTFSTDTSKPGKLTISDIDLYEYNNASAQPITIKSPASLASPYSLTLPAATPATLAVLTMDTDGTVQASRALTTFVLGTANQVTVSAGTGQAVVLSLPAQIQQPAGSVGVPSYSSTVDSTSGIWFSGAGKVNFTAGGVTVGEFNGSGAVVNGTLRLAAGSRTAPAVYGTAASNTGLYFNSATEIDVTVGGSDVAAFTSAGVISLAGIATDAASYIKWKTFTGTISTAGTQTLTVTGATLLSAVGLDTTAGRRYPIGPALYSISGGPAGLEWAASGAADSVIIANTFASGTHTLSYRVILYYT